MHHCVHMDKWINGTNRKHRKKKLTYLLVLVTLYYYKWRQLQITKLNNWLF